MNLKIYTAKRGEGKTHWLFGKAVSAHESGKKLYYVGKPHTMRGLENMWESHMHTKCPIVNACDVYSIEPNSCCLTDELFLNITSVGFFYDVVKDIEDMEWFITISQEVFE